MPDYLTFSDTDLPLDAASLAELQALAAEAMGWLAMSEGTYLHVGNESDDVITVVGVADASMVGMNVLLLVG